MRKTLNTLAIAAAGVLACGLATASAGPAAAVAPGQNASIHQVTPSHATHHGRRPHRHGGGGHGHGPGSALLGSSTGVHLYNNSVDKLVLTAVSGSNEGVPQTGSVLTSGVGYQDFEVTFRAAKSTTVTAAGSGWPGCRPGWPTALRSCCCMGNHLGRFCTGR